MKYRLQVSVLRPAASGFDVWDWAEGFDLIFAIVIEESEADCYTVYEEVMADAGVEFAQTDELSGKIHNERGRVYRCKVDLADSDRRNGLNDGDLDTYEMVWGEPITDEQAEALLARERAQ